MTSSFDAAGLTVFERGWLSSNNVLFDGGERYESVLIDSGYCTHATQTVALVHNALGARRLDRVVNTHLHSDHCGGNHALQAAFDCAVDVPAGEIDKVDRWDETLLSYRDTGQRCPRFTRTGAIRAGDQLRCGAWLWQVIASPGHDPESVVLHQPELKVLISADALWENGFGVVFPELEGLQAFDDVRDTLNCLGRLQVEWIIPGHGSPFRGLGDALGRAHSRLDGFIADPARHARHAAKVLIKFHLLEVQSSGVVELLGWLASTKYMQVSHGLYFENMPFTDWSTALLRELAAARAISIGDGKVRNI